jgi:hypothetical protein
MSSRIVLYIDNVNMGLGHPGLTEMAKKFKVHPEKMGPHDLLMFINRAKDKLKVMGSQGKVIAYLRMPHRQRLRLEAIQYIPQVFSTTGKIDYDAALRESLVRSLGVVKEGKPTPLQVYRAQKAAGVTATP